MLKKYIFSLTIALVLAVCSISSHAGNLSEYYGFGQIEILKFDWEISNLNITDLNNDGRNDIIFANNRKARVEILLQKQNIGKGEEFVSVDPNDIDINAIEPLTRFKKNSVPVSQKILSLVCGDFNNDGLIDLAYYGDPEGLYVLLQKKDPGKKTDEISWHTRKKIAIDDGLTTKRALAASDMNNDGLTDLMLAGKNDIYAVYQQKDATLAEPQKYPSSDQPLDIYTGDLNGDNLNDLILLTNDTEKPLSIRFGLATGQLGPQRKFFIEKPYKIQIDNIDNEPGDEICIIDARTGRLICYKLSNMQPDASDWPILFYPLEAQASGNKRDLVTADLNADKLEDIIISQPGAAELTVYKQLKGVGLAEPVKFPAFSEITNLSAADIDKNGKSVIAAFSLKEKIIGLSRYADNRLSFPQSLKVSGEPVAMTTADIDNDSKIDCIYISKDPNDKRQLRIIYDLGKNSEDLEPNSLLAIDKLESNPEGIKCIDVDQDGLLDILVFVKFDSPILIRQTEIGEFEIIDSPYAQASLVKNTSISTVTAANINGKNKLQLLIAEKNFARSLLFENGKTWKVTDQYNAKSTENSIIAVNAFKLDGISDGKKPAIFLLDGQKGQLQILTAGEDNTYRFYKQLDVGRWNNSQHTKIMQVNIGKEKNILLFDSEKFALINPPDKDEGTLNFEQMFSYETKIKEGVYGNIICGDINADSREDIIMVEYKRNHIEILALDADSRPVPAIRFKIFEQKSYIDDKSSKSSVEPRELKVSNVTGDDMPDLVTIIHDRIIIYPQD